MKLLSYHIENYGKIQNMDGRFDGMLTEFCEKNGHGKTTMASFIRAMFYGLPTYTTKTKAFDDRQHFYPFNGGKFGGNITFEMQGKVYKIERFFDKKSNKGDECKVYADGALYMGFGEDIGKAVFGLDEESFKKTVFITADEIEIEATHGINEKLNRDVLGSADNDFEAAVDALDKAKKELKAARGNNDLISAKKTEIVELTARIQNLQDMGEGLTDQYLERERLTKEIVELEDALKSASEYNLVVQKWETLDNLSVQVDQKRQALAEYQEKYPQGTPTEEERQTLRDCAQEEAKLLGALQSTSFGEDKEKTLAELAQKFASGVPTEKEIAEKQQMLVEMATVTAEVDALKNRPQTDGEKALSQRFAGGIPTEEALTAKRAKLEEYKHKDAQLKELHNALVNTPTPQTTKGGVGKWICFLLAAVCLVGCVALLIYQQYFRGIGFAVVGAGLAASGVFMHTQGGTNRASNGDMTVKIASAQAEMRVLEEELRAFTVPYRYYSEAGVVYDFTVMEQDLRAYQAQQQAAEDATQKIENATQKITSMQSEVREYLTQYGENGDLQDGLHKLLSTYQALLADQAAASDQIKDVRARIEACQERSQNILKTYGLSTDVGTMDGLNGLEVDCKRWGELRADMEKIDVKRSTYKEANGLTERPETRAQDTDELHGNLSTLRKQLADCDKRIAEIEREVEKLPDAENDLEQAEEKLEEYKKKHQLLTDVIDALKGAEKTLQDRYVAPIRDRFSHYTDLLEKVLGEKISMDSDYRVKFERGGEDRSDRHLSAGERSLCALCLRLALIDNMYEGEQPFIVMDDPFVHLDEEHLHRVADLLGTLAQERQILYFCCHSSRSVTK